MGFIDDLVKEMKVDVYKPQALSYDKNAMFAQGMKSTISGGKGLTKPSMVGFTTLKRMSRSYVIARMCMNTLKHEITKIKWNIDPKDKKGVLDPAKVELIENLLHKPNDQKTTWRTFIDTTLEDILALDAGVWEKVRNVKGEIAALYNVDGSTIRPCYDEYGVIGDPAYVQYISNQMGPWSSTANKPDAEFSKDDIVYIMQNPQADVNSFGYGLSPIESTIMVATNALMADSYNGKFFDDEAIPSSIIWIGEELSQGSLDSFRDYWRAEVKGQPYATPIIGGMPKPEVIPYKPSQTDMQFMEYSEWLARITIAAFEMSPQDIGLDLKMYQSAAGTQQNLSKSQGIASIMHLIKEYIDVEILGDAGWNGAYDDAQFCWEEIDALDEERRTIILNKQIGAPFKTINEGRKELGLEAIAGGERIMIVGKGGEPTYIDSRPLDELEESEIESLKEIGTEQEQEAKKKKDEMSDISRDGAKIANDNMKNGKDKETPDKKLKKFMKSTEQEQMDMVDEAFVDEEKLSHPTAGEYAYCACGDMVTEERKRIDMKIFKLAAEFAYQGKEDLIGSLGLVNVETTNSLKVNIDRIASLLKENAYASYGVITGMEAGRPKYTIYKVKEDTLYKSYGFLLKKKLADLRYPYEIALTGHIQKELKKLYPKLMDLVDVKKSHENYSDWDLDKPEDKLTFNIDFWEEAFRAGAGYMAIDLVTYPRKEPSYNQVVTKSHGLLSERTKASARSAANTVHQDVLDYIESNQGRSYEEMSKAIKKILGWEDGWRATRIAKTETNWAFNKGIYKMGGEAGIERWYVASGPNPCPICEQETNNFRRTYTSREIDGKFPLHPNCYCIVEASI